LSDELVGGFLLKTFIVEDASTRVQIKDRPNHQVSARSRRMRGESEEYSFTVLFKADQGRAEKEIGEKLYDPSRVSRGESDEQ